MYLHKSRSKWDNVLNLTTSNEQWKMYCSIPFSVSVDVTIRWFQFRIINRILATNSLLHKMNISESDTCGFCNICTESLQHLLFDCCKVNFLWKYLNNVIRNNNITFLNLETVLLGGNFDRNLNLIIILVKFYIYRNKSNGTLPSINGMLVYLKKNNF